MRSFICVFLLATAFLFGCDEPSELYSPINLSPPPTRFSEVEWTSETRPVFGRHIELTPEVQDGLTNGEWVGVCTHLPVTK